MSIQITSTTVCWLLVVVLPPLSLTQDDHCHVEAPGWPHCLSNRLNGTYYITPGVSENISCLFEPCFTLVQIEDFFTSDVSNNSKTAPNDLSALVFLPGEYTLTQSLQFYKQNGTLSLTGCVGNNTISRAILECKDDHIELIFKESAVNISHLQLARCTLLATQGSSLTVEYVLFSNAWLRVVNTSVTTLSNSNVTIMRPYCCTGNNYFSAFYIESACIMEISNVLFTSHLLPYENAIVLEIHNSTVAITSSDFSGRSNHIALTNTSLNMSGTFQFSNGNPAILGVKSTIQLTGIGVFQHGHTAVKVLNTPISLAGNISFVDNCDHKGGAMSLSDSAINIADYAYVLFQSNRADVFGGAIFSTGSDIANYISFAQATKSCQISFGTNSRVEFINNTAEMGGSAMYGISTSDAVCNDNNEIYYDVLTIEPDYFSAISSDPLRVCICPDLSTPDCLAILPEQTISHLHYTVYPGQYFTIPAAVVGFNFARTSGSVFAEFLNSNATLGSKSQYVQELSNAECIDLQYSVLSGQRQETLILTSNGRSVTQIPNNIKDDIVNQSSTRYLANGLFQLAGNVPLSLQTIPIFVSVTLLDCPLGFVLTDPPQRCECNKRILKLNFTCDINNQTVYRDGKIWINASFNGNTSDGVIVHQQCPFGYCRREPVNVNLKDPDTQCYFNRSGTLCGNCKENMSLALGGSQCLSECSDRYISLLIPFALAGFALVFFISILNLTVAQGTINGLIYYGNILAANQSIFIGEQRNNLLQFLALFNSWVNLDLGFETCFIKGLNAYWKTWLQFVFPFYVWAIAGGIIIASRYSSRATKIFGKNSVSVLATLFLLSYGKLLRSIITTFSFTVIVHPDNSTSALWAFNGNVDYLDAEHIILLVFALAIILLLWLPYTSALLSAQWLRTKTHRKGLQWLKPFLDAYYGPFKDKHHYWVGVLLLLRGILFVFFASFFAHQSNIHLLLVVVSTMAIAAWPSIAGRLYKNIILSTLENAYFLNLGVLAAGTYHIRLVGGSQEALITISLGIAFLQFVGITVYHTYKFVGISLVELCSNAFGMPREKHRNEVEPNIGLYRSIDWDNRARVVTQSELHMSQLLQETQSSQEVHNESANEEPCSSEFCSYYHRHDESTEPSTAQPQRDSDQQGAFITIEQPAGSKENKPNGVRVRMYVNESADNVTPSDVRKPVQFACAGDNIEGSCKLAGTHSKLESCPVVSSDASIPSRKTTSITTVQGDDTLIVYDPARYRESCLEIVDS